MIKYIINEIDYRIKKRSNKLCVIKKLKKLLKFMKSKKYTEFEKSLIFYVELLQINIIHKNIIINKNKLKSGGIVRNDRIKHG